MNPSQEEHISMQALIKNLAQVASRVSSEAARLDDEIGEAFEKGATALISMETIQSVDSLRQSLDCLNAVIVNLSCQNLPDKELSIPALGENVYLASMREACFFVSAHHDNAA